MNEVPIPSCPSQMIVPPNFSTFIFAIYNPNPVPEDASVALKNILKISL